MTDFVNVAAWLPEMARNQPDALAVVVAKRRGWQRVTCTELNAACDRIAHGLESIGIGKGTRTVLMVKPSPAFFALTFALFKVGAVPVLVDPGMGIRNLGQCLAEAEPEAFIGIPQAHIARKVLGWGRSTIRIKLTVGPRLFWRGTTLRRLEAGAPSRPYTMPGTSPDQMAAVLFTSGSTGVPKGAVYTHSIFASQVRLLRDTYGIAPGEVDLSTFPLFALFGPALGMTSVVPWMNASKPASADPKRLVEAIQTWKCTNMFASPALINLLGRYGEQQQHNNLRLPTLKRAISAGAPASPPALRRFTALLGPGVQVFTPYGATESLPVANIGSDAILGETGSKTEEGAGVCVGQPVDSMTVAIIGIDDQPIDTWSDTLRLEPGDIGEIVVRGPVVTERYYNRERSTRLSKIADGNGGLWHRMGDLGYLDRQGRLWMCGRKAHRVELDDGTTLFTIPCEAVFNARPGVFRTALVGVSHAGQTVPVICVELDKGASPEAVLHDLRATAQRFEHTRRLSTFLIHPKGFPVDVRHNAKIFREKL
ncbi:MAG: fatty acid CoA ligase family protein, partial [Myxococcota bacterium]